MKLQIFTHLHIWNYLLAFPPFHTITFDVHPCPTLQTHPSVLPSRPTPQLPHPSSADPPSSSCHPAFLARPSAEAPLAVHPLVRPSVHHPGPAPSVWAGVTWGEVARRPLYIRSAYRLGPWSNSRRSPGQSYWWSVLAQWSASPAWWLCHVRRCAVGAGRGRSVRWGGISQPVSRRFRTVSPHLWSGQCPRWHGWSLRRCSVAPSPEYPSGSAPGESKSNVRNNLPRQVSAFYSETMSSFKHDCQNIVLIIILLATVDLKSCLIHDVAKFVPLSSGRWSEIPDSYCDLGSGCWSWSNRCPHTYGSPTSWDTANRRPRQTQADDITHTTYDYERNYFEKECKRLQLLSHVISIRCTASPLSFNIFSFMNLGSSGCAVEHRTVNRGDGGSIPPTAVSKLRQFRSPHNCLCLSEETLKALLSGVYSEGSKRSHPG